MSSPSRQKVDAFARDGPDSVGTGAHQVLADQPNNQTTRCCIKGGVTKPATVAKQVLDEPDSMGAGCTIGAAG